MPGLPRRRAAEGLREDRFFPRRAAFRGSVSGLILLVLSIASAGSGLADSNPSLYLVDSQFTTRLSRIFQVDPESGAMELRTDLGTTFTPVLAMAAASATVVYLAGTDTGPADLCQGDIACLLIRVEIDPLSITPASVQLVGPITEGGSVIAGITGMTFRNDGRLYAISQDNDRLYTIDLTTAVATRIGTVDLTLHGGDITFDGIDRLWLWTNLGPGAGLYLVDPATTHASAFDLHPFLDMAGLTALGHGLRLRGGSQSTDRLYEIDTVVGLTGNDALLTLDGARFDFARGDLDSPYCEGDADCSDEDSCTVDECSPGGCLHHPADDGTSCDDGNACTQVDSCHSGTCTGASPVVCLAPDACHEPGACNPASGVCENPPDKPDGTVCSDGNACTQVDSCHSGTCTGASPVVCSAPDACHDPGTCNPASGVCENPPDRPDGTVCNDGNACTQVDSCHSGTCTGASPVVCLAPDACHDAGICDPSTGSCGESPPKPDGASCSDGNGCTLGDTCQGGVCHGGPPLDLDGDGHVDASCGGNDCSDSNPLVWSVPLEVTGLAVNTASSTELTWDSQDLLAGPETSFDLVSGPLPGGPVFSFSSSTCLQTGGGVAYSDGRADPLPAEGFWFLARARNSCGTGSFGSSQRDESTAPCP